MKVIVKSKIGSVIYQFEIEEQKELETLHKAIVLTSPRKKCTACGSIGYDNKYLTTNKSTNEEGTFTYVNCKCAKCGARSKLGQYKAGGYFWNDYVEYKPKDGVEKPKTDKDFNGENSKGAVDEDIPFPDE